MNTSIAGKRVLVTQSQAFMGAPLVSTLSNLGAEVIADKRDFGEPDAARQCVEEAGDIDVLVANLAIAAPSTPVERIEDDEWKTVFKALVDPLPRLVSAVLPQMIARQSGKIIVMGSASALRGMKRTATYSAARGAQVSYVQAAGAELARHNIQVNIIAQNFVDNPTYFPPEVQSNERFQERLQREVPLGRLVSAEEDAAFVAYLCSDAANCFVGQVFPVCGGWVAN